MQIYGRSACPGPWSGELTSSLRTAARRPSATAWRRVSFSSRSSPASLSSCVHRTCESKALPGHDRGAKVVAAALLLPGSQPHLQLPRALQAGQVVGDDVHERFHVAEVLVHELGVHRAGERGVQVDLHPRTGQPSLGQLARPCRAIRSAHLVNCTRSRWGEEPAERLSLLSSWTSQVADDDARAETCQTSLPSTPRSFSRPAKACHSIAGFIPFRLHTVASGSHQIFTRLSTVPTGSSARPRRSPSRW